MTTIAERPIGLAGPAPTRSGAPAGGRHRATTTVAGTTRRIVSRIGGVLGTLLLVLTALILLGMTVGPRVFHYKTATMLTGSMVPTIRPGDVVVDVREKAAAIAVGQIVTYHIPVDDHRVESHRVVWVRHQKDGSTLFRTKGDANNGADPWTAKAVGSDVWRVKTVLPFAGTIIRFLRQPVVQLGLTRVLPALLVTSVLFSLWRRPTRPAEATEYPAS